MLKRYLCQQIWSPAEATLKNIAQCIAGVNWYRHFIDGSSKSCACTKFSCPKGSNDPFRKTED
jgi:hypothetical protein